MKDNKTNKIVVYTAIFGRKDILQEPEYIPAGVDFVCLTDQHFKSKIWKIVQTAPPFPEDLTRSNRYFKILTHRFFPDYEYSIYLDGNVILTGDVTKLINEYLKSDNFAAFDASKYSYLPSNSVEHQMLNLLRPGQELRNNETYDAIKSQYKSYLEDGFPDKNGCIMGLILIRKHNSNDVIQAMEEWWNQVRLKSKRDLMSFNYVAWKFNLSFKYIPLDASNNSYIKKIRHFKPWYVRLFSRLHNRLNAFLK